MPALIDITGQVFGRWTVISYHGSGYWKCECDCGTKRTVKKTSMIEGNSVSCGCYQKERVSEAGTKHGHNTESGQSPTYKSWRAMLARCQNSTRNNYARYGGRGIKVCDRWRKFEYFLEDMGLRPEGRSLDRIDNDKDYSPDNCCWSTQKEQSNNMSRNHHLEFAGKRQTISEWADELGIPYGTLFHRIRRGWSVERSLTT